MVLKSWECIKNYSQNSKKTLYLVKIKDTTSILRIVFKTLLIMSQDCDIMLLYRTSCAEEFFKMMFGKF